MLLAWLILVLSAAILLATPFQRTRFVIVLRRFFVALVAASAGIYFFYILSAKVLYRLLPQTTVTITALNDKNETAQSYDIVVKGFVVDKVWYWAKNLKHSDSGWIDYDAGAYYWKAFDKPVSMTDSISFEIPSGRDKTIVFEKNKWHGKALIKTETTESIVDTYSDSDSEDYGVSLGSSKISTWDKIRKYTSVCFGGVVFILIQFFFILSKNNPKNQVSAQKRIIWMDFLRISCIFTVIFLHYTTSLYEKNYTGSFASWIPSLIVNCFTTFAVPCFFMLSGALILNKNESLSSLLKKRLPSVYIPLIIWSGIYIAYFGALQGSSITAFFKSLYTSQYYHLWFMYPLIGLYFLSPVIRSVLLNSDESIKKYAFVLVCIVPTILLTIAKLFRLTYISFWFTWGFPEIGLFVLGAWLVQKKLPVRKALLGSAVSLLLIILGELSCFIFGETPHKNFIGAYGTFPVFMFAVFMFAVFMSSEPYLTKLPESIKNRVASISKLSVGIYFTHLLAKALLDKTNIYQTDSKSFLMMLFAAIINFLFSLAICYVFSKIPFVGWIFGKSSSSSCYVNIYTKQINRGGHGNGMVGMRVIATFLIAIYHWELYYKFLPNMQIFSCAFLCVEFFFVLSGFLLAKGMIEKKNSQTFVNMVSNRFIRLWPAFIVGTLLLPCIYVITWFGGNYKNWLLDGNHLKAFLIEIPMLQTTGFAGLEYINGPAWYASALLICSAILYFVIKYVKKVYWGIALFFSILFFSISFANTPTNFVFNVIPFPLVRGMAGMSLGVFAYFVHTKAKYKIQKLPRFVVSLTEIIALIFFFKMLLIRESNNLNLIVLIPIFVLIVIMFSENFGIISIILKNKELAYLAEISYAFYIMQSFCSNIFTCLYPNMKIQPIVTVVYLCLNLVVAIGVHEFIEKPLTTFLLWIKNSLYKEQKNA